MTRPDARPAIAAAVVLVSAALLVLVVLTRSRPVEVSVPPAAGSDACRSASTHWPGAIGDAKVRDTSPQNPAVRAWGDPAIIARCGLPALGPTTDQCLAVGGVDWVAEPLSDGTRLTTYGRDPAIEVLAPSAAGPGAMILPDLADAARALPSNGRSCV